MQRLLALLSFVLAATAASAQSLPIQSVLDGKTIPAVMKPKELPGDYFAVRIAMTGEFNFLDLYGGLAFSGGFDTSGSQERRRAKEAVTQAAGVFWTKGQHVSVEGHDFLVTYRLNVPVAAIAGNSRGFDSWAMENPLELSLELVRPESIGRMSPVPTLSPEKMAKAIEAFERSLREDFGLPPGADLASAVPQGADQRSMQTMALSNIKQVSLGMLMYSTDYDDMYPTKPSIAHVRNVTRPYMKNDSLWKTGNPNKSQFLFNPMLYGVAATDVERPAECPLFYESAAWPDGRRVVSYTDGHAKLISADEWKKYEKLLKVKIKHQKPPTPPAAMAKPKGRAKPKPRPPAQTK